MFIGSPLPGAFRTRWSSNAVVVAGRPFSISASLAVVRGLDRPAAWVGCEVSRRGKVHTLKDRLQPANS